jgi:hypothetical protein
MEKKRPLGVTIFGFLLLGFAIMQGGLIFFVFRNTMDMSLLLGINFTGSEKNYYPAVSFLIPRVFLLGLLVGIALGILRLKRWSYYLLLGFSALFLFLKLFTLRGIWRYINEGGIKVFLFESALLSAFFIALLLYFTRKQIKEIFLAGEGPRDDKWSLALIFLGWFFVLNGVRAFSLTISSGFDFSLRVLAFGWVYYLVDILCGVGFLLRKEIMRKFGIGFSGFTILVAFFGFGFTGAVVTLVINGLIIYFLIRPEVKEKFLA